MQTKPHQAPDPAHVRQIRDNDLHVRDRESLGPDSTRRGWDTNLGLLTPRSVIFPHLSTAATLPAPSGPQFPHLHKRGFPEGTSVPLAVPVTNSSTMWPRRAMAVKKGRATAYPVGPSVTFSQTSWYTQSSNLAPSVTLINQLSYLPLPKSPCICV